MHLVNQKYYSNNPSQCSEGRNVSPNVITVIDTLGKVRKNSAQLIDEREFELEHVAVLAYD